ncbi:uncharacterized protein LOC129613821 [Condylostylus longicornis]|uniref:uncharacterized protein LOC129613821 n=1 Tax=Condylostylus longicornis TaxID=2530218 RepID=UPI00244E4CDB|nr:uncharacterized protein LOC129613821 [Condylostylus longicornis]
MSKRITSYDVFGGTLNHKKPKLDISATKRNEINYGASTSNNTSKDPFKKPNAVSSVPNIWNDDDDDDLLIISQMVENKIQSNDVFGRNSEDFDNISITFEHFGSHVESSTQLAKTAKITSNQKYNVDSSSLFDDSFEFEWENNNFKNDNSCDAFKSSSTNLNHITEKKIQNEKPKLMSLKNDNFSVIRNDFTSSNISNDRQRDAIEIDKLIQNLDALQNENKKCLAQLNTLSEQINDLNEKVQTKEGEASLLRQELRSSKQALDTLRVQKISENDTIRKEYQYKITELGRMKNGIQAQLNQKKIENAQLKQKQAIDENSIEILRKYQDLSNINNLNFRFEKEVLSRTNLDLPCEILSKNYTLNYSLVEKYFQSQYDELSSILLQWNHNMISDEIYKNFETKRFEHIFEDAIEKLIKYIELDSSKCCTLTENTFKSHKQPTFCKLCSKKGIEIRNIFFASKITKFERMTSFRRFVGMLCFIAKSVPNIGAYILNSIKTALTSTQQNFDNILELIISSPNIDHYMGILESIGLVLKTLGKVKSFDENYLKYFNIIIHCIPNLRVMAEIANCIQEISENKHYLNKMCKKSPRFKTSYTANKKITRICKSGCILQTFCTILEFKIQLEEKYLYIHKFEILNILRNYIKLLGNCFKTYPVFMINPSLESSYNETKNTFDINHSICNCYALLCCSFVFVFSKFLKFWIEDEFAFNINVFQEICKAGSILLCDIFDTHYQPVIIFIGNTSVKRNLFLILDCLKKKAELLNNEYESIITVLKNCSMLSDRELNTTESQEINLNNGKKIIEEIFAEKLFI